MFLSTSEVKQGPKLGLWSLHLYFPYRITNRPPFLLSAISVYPTPCTYWVDPLPFGTNSNGLETSVLWPDEEYSIPYSNGHTVLVPDPTTMSPSLRCGVFYWTVYHRHTEGKVKKSRDFSLWVTTLCHRGVCSRLKDHYNVVHYIIVLIRLF